jgi:hypothetical protein
MNQTKPNFIQKRSRPALYGPYWREADVHTHNVGFGVFASAIAGIMRRNRYSAFAVMKMYRKGPEPVLITSCSVCAGA